MINDSRWTRACPCAPSCDAVKLFVVEQMCNKRENQRMQNQDKKNKGIDYGRLLGQRPKWMVFFQRRQCQRWKMMAMFFYSSSLVEACWHVEHVTIVFSGHHDLQFAAENSRVNSCLICNCTRRSRRNSDVQHRTLGFRIYRVAVKKSLSPRIEPRKESLKSHEFMHDLYAVLSWHWEITGNHQKS